MVARRESVSAAVFSGKLSEIRQWTLRMITIVLIILVLVLIGALPTWPYSSQWGFYPSGGLGLVLILVLILWLMGYV
jgi:Protein of unknown function (DUF3309)